MPQLENRTPFVAMMFVLPDAQGIDTLFLAVKATFDIGTERMRVAAKQRPLLLHDEYWGMPAQSSIRYAGEIHPCKWATDVAVVGTAHAPYGEPSPCFEASLSVGQLTKTVNVFGERRWKAGLLRRTSITEPEPLLRAPLYYELAFGGRHELPGGHVLADPRNPVGRGFRGGRRTAELHEIPLPLFELPSSHLADPSDLPEPAGFGFVAPHWQPRARLAGTYDKAWERTRAPSLPEDFDPRFFQAVAPDQVYSGYLEGGERVELVNLSPKGFLAFTLPAMALHAQVHVGDMLHMPKLRLETVLIEPDANRLCLTWRAAVACDKATLCIEKASVEVDRMALAS